MRRVLIFIATASVLYFSFNSYSDAKTKNRKNEIEWLQIKSIQGFEISQSSDDYFKNACVVFSISYSLKNGPKRTRNIYGAIAGATDDAKIRKIFDQYSSKITDLRGKPRSIIDPTLQTNPAETATLLNEIASVNASSSKLRFAYKTLVRGQSEKEPGTYLRRIQSMIARNIEAGFPTPMHVFWKEFNTETSKLKNLNGHVISIIAIENNISKNGDKFRFRYHEPDTNTIEEGYAYENRELDRPDYLFSYGTHAQVTWSADFGLTVKGSKTDRPVGSPFILLKLGPALDVNPSKGRYQTTARAIVQIENENNL